MKLANDGIKTPPIKVRSGPQRISASFPQKFDGPLEDEYRMVEQSLVDVSAGTVPGMTTLPHLHQLSITGPTVAAGVSETPSRRKIFTCRPTGDDEVPCAKKIIANLARQAYRRPVNDNDLEEPARLLSARPQRWEFRLRNPHGDSGNDRQPRIRVPIRAYPAGHRAGQELPHQRSGTGVAPLLSSCGAARRMSNWSRVAIQGKLKDPSVFEKQVRRMLADSRASALTTNFAGQWLRLQNLKGVSPDLFEYPGFRPHPRRLDAPRDGAAVRQHRARRPQRPRPADRRLHVRQ